MPVAEVSTVSERSEGSAMLDKLGYPSTALLGRIPHLGAIIFDSHMNLALLITRRDDRAASRSIRGRDNLKSNVAVKTYGPRFLDAAPANGHPRRSVSSSHVGRR